VKALLTRRTACGLLAAAPLAAARRASAAEPIDGTAIFARAKATFRSHRRPEFVVYTLRRTETRDGKPLDSGTYVLRIWYRSGDRAAMSRRLAVPAPLATSSALVPPSPLTTAGQPGPLVFLQVAFNQPTDPGPPTTDIFEPVPPHGGVLPTPLPHEDMRTIQNVHVAAELDYSVLNAELAGDAYHLWVQPRRDVDRNRLRELWIDAQTYDVRRATANDRLYFSDSGGGWVPDIFDMALELQDSVPVIRTIASTTEVDKDTIANGPHDHIAFSFEDIAFPDTLPSWYFHPKEYGFHMQDAPQY
jgi:hypothetical protein